MEIFDQLDAEQHSYSRSMRLRQTERMECIGYSHKGKQYIPDIANASWSGTERPNIVRLAGNVLKKDGSPGQHRTTCDYWMFEKPLYGTKHEAPEWLKELFADIEPKPYENSRIKK